MPIKTPKFGFEAFITGDIYSASADKRRFNRIDQHMSFLSSTIKDGVIDGWVLSEKSPLTLSLSSGLGMIGQVVARTQNEITRNLLDNTETYAWMRIRPGQVGEFSSFSNLALTNFIDDEAPDIPINLQVTSKTISSINISWQPSPDNDFDKFLIYRCTEGTDFKFLAETKTPSFMDINLEDDTNYFYKILSVDRTGNQSDFSTVLEATTDLDTTPPGDPLSVELTNSNNTVHLLWRPPIFGEVKQYKAEITPITPEGVSEGDTFSAFTESDEISLSILDLTNGQRYRILFRTVGTNNELSDGVVLLANPDFSFSPPDVVDINVVDEENDDLQSEIALNISWIPFLDPYVDTSNVSGHQIQIVERNVLNSTEFVSEIIQVPEGNSRTIKIYPYRDENAGIIFRRILPRTEYLIIIKSFDQDGRTSVGKPIRHRTRSFNPPSRVTRLLSQQTDDQSIRFTWRAPDSFVDHYEVSVNRTSLVNPGNNLVIENNKDIGLSTSFIVPAESILPGVDIEFSIVVVDEFGNRSAAVETVFPIPNFDALSNPPVPSQQFGTGNDGQAIISWNSPSIRFFSGFRIYRAKEAISYVSSDFTRLETVNKDTFEFTDHTASNNITYVYFITTIDIFGKESLNPIDDDFFDYNFVTITPNRTGNLQEPTNLSVSVSSDPNSADVILSWDATGGTFDGYEIWRSINNIFSFQKIDSVGPSTTTYVDKDALLEQGVYNYLVRKFRNESDLFLTESSASVVGSVFLGKIITDNGSMSFDLKGRRNIKNLEDLIREETIKKLNVHTHEFVSDIDDRRINLSDRIQISNWATNDFKIYTTNTDISETTTFTILVNNDNINNQNIFATLDKNQGRISFEEKLFDANSDSSLFDEPPLVSVIFDELSEVKNKVPRERFEGASASQVTNGLVRKNQLPKVGHEGRVKEILTPEQEDMFPVDNGYRFAPVNSEVSRIGEALVWYDVIPANEFGNDLLLASTSDGIYTSDNFGVRWRKRFQPITPALKLFHSKEKDFYFALTNRGVLGTGTGPSGRGLSGWSEIRGMENSKIARSIVEDNDSNIFCSSDIGVFKLIKDVGRGSFFWEQTPIFGPRSTESFAMLYDDTRDRIIVSNELGIFETNDQGDQWSFSPEFTEQRSIWDFYKQGDTIWAITDFIVWRRKFGEIEFEKVAVFDEVDRMRRLVIFQNRIYITTDIGLLVSDLNSDIQNDDSINFEIAFSEININSYISPPTSINKIADLLFVGTEDRLYVATKPGSISLHSEIQKGLIPTVTVDGVEQTIGYRFTTDTRKLGKFVTFDNKIAPDSTVTFANQYKKFKSLSGGWADKDFSSRVTLFLDDKPINNGSVAEKPISDISNIVWPSFNDRNANATTASESLNQLLTIQNTLTNIGNDAENPTDENFTKENVRQFLKATNRFLSQLLVQARVIPDLDNQGNQVFVDNSGKIVSSDIPGSTLKTKPFALPDIKVLLLSKADIFETLSISSFGIYNEVHGEEDDIGRFGSELDDDGNVTNIL